MKFDLWTCLREFPPSVVAIPSQMKFFGLYMTYKRLLLRNFSSNLLFHLLYVCTGPVLITCVLDPS